MAGSLASINIKFFADLKQFSTAMANSERQIKKMGRNLTKAGKNLTVGLTAPLTAMAAVSLKTFNDQAQAIAQLEAGLKSTGNAVGFTSEELQKMASELQNNTLFGDEEILKGATSQLLTFTNIAGDQFARTQVAALDLATRLDGDLKSASIQLGKALNDPVANLSALSRSGIQFSEDQKQTINALVETNRLADAQTLILDELSTQYGGSAAAAAEAGTGGITQLGNILGDVSEDFGAIINEAIKPFIAKIKELALAFKALSPETKKIIVVVGALVAAIGPLLVALGFLMTSVVPGLITVFTFLSTTALPAVVTGFNAFTAAVLANPIGIVVAAVAALGYALVSMLQSLTPAVSKLKTFLNLIKSGGSAIKFANLQLADEAKAIADEARLKDEASKAAAKFASDQYFAAEATKTLTANLLKQAAAAKTVATPSKARVTGVKSAGVQGGFAIPNFGEDAKLAEGQLEHLKVKMNSFQLAAEEVGYAVGDAFMNLGMNIVDSLGLADDGFQGFAKGLLTTVTKLIAMMLGTSIANSIAGATASGAATGPAAVFTTPAFIATAVGGVLSAFASIPKFATGGIVGGTSYYGDKLLAMVNSGEAILNTDQQKTLYNAVGSGGTTQVPYIADTIISGNDLKIILKRQDKFDNRRS